MIQDPGRDARIMKVIDKTNFLTLQVHNRGLLALRGVWLLTLILMITLFVVGIPAFVEYIDGRVPTTALARLTLPGENTGRITFFG